MLLTIANNAMREQREIIRETQSTVRKLRINVDSMPEMGRRVFAPLLPQFEEQVTEACAYYRELDAWQCAIFASIEL